MNSIFPPDFTWGAAASSYQLEGAWNEDGKGMSVCDMMFQRPGKAYRDHNGNVACDHYHRFREDVGLMREIGLKAYRFSISWPRILPEGSGKVNSKGLAFYDRLVDALLAAGITPWATLFHWDYPLSLYQRGGWLNRDSAEWFADYAAVVARALGDRVKHWITFNETQCFIGLGHQTGVHAPGDKLAMGQLLRAMHHVLLAHGRAVQSIRANLPAPGMIGWAPTSGARIPATEKAADIEAARRDYFSVQPNSMFGLSLWSDPVYLGRYPEEAAAVYGNDWIEPTAEDMKIIAQPLDFMGYNCYWGAHMRATANGTPQRIPFPPGGPTGSLLWLEVTPESLYWVTRFQIERYGRLPFVITENGFCNLDWVALDGKVHDPQRIDYIQRYLQGVQRGLREGLPIAAYFYWSVMDNFEWADGYKDRFGLIHVDYETQKRTLKDSALWYAEVIRTNGALLEVAAPDSDSRSSS